MNYVSEGNLLSPLFNPLDPDTQIKTRLGGFIHCLRLVLWAAAQWARSPGGAGLHGGESGSAWGSESAQPSGGALPASPWLLPGFDTKPRPVSSPGLLGWARASELRRCPSSLDGLGDYTVAGHSAIIRATRQERERTWRQLSPQPLI